MTRNDGRFTEQFKAKVAMDALRSVRTIPAIVAEHEGTPNQVSGWKAGKRRRVCSNCWPTPPSAAKPTTGRSFTTCTRT